MARRNSWTTLLVQECIEQSFELVRHKHSTRQLGMVHFLQRKCWFLDQASRDQLWLVRNSQSRQEELERIGRSSKLKVHSKSIGDMVRGFQFGYIVGLVHCRCRDQQWVVDSIESIQPGWEHREHSLMIRHRNRSIRILGRVEQWGSSFLIGHHRRRVGQWVLHSMQCTLKCTLEWFPNLFLGWVRISQHNEPIRSQLANCCRHFRRNQPQLQQHPELKLKLLQMVLQDLHFRTECH